jgi:hypothetical protein
MDPNRTLKHLRFMLGGCPDFISPEDQCCDMEDAIALYHEAMELFQSLDNWISSGGFLPKDWTDSCKEKYIFLN